MGKLASVFRPMDSGDAIEPVMDNNNNLVHKRKSDYDFVCNCTGFTKRP